MCAKKRENPMAVRSKSALAQALLAIMINKKFDEVSISEITEKAGLSRQTFYTNFSRKEDILAYLLDGLFDRYRSRIASMTSPPENILVDYFIFWDKNKDFLSLLFEKGMGYLFQECNREFFVKHAEKLDPLFTCEKWQVPYIKAAMAGVCYELLMMWIVDDQGLSVNTLTALSGNFLSGRIFG